MKPFDYATPSRLEDAVKLLLQTPGARVIAGGSQLLVEPSRSQLSAPLLVDLRKIDALAGIETTKDGVRVGAMTTAAVVAASATLQASHAAMAEAAALVGDPQVRNRATVGGALAANDPAADLPAALLALGAHVQVAGPMGKRSESVDALLGRLGVGEVIVSVTLPVAAPGTGSAYKKSGTLRRSTRCARWPPA